tara:strand:+ start:51 stop:761 length:711 start_codon:yes stop_codon:yes gene_type:complete
MQLASITFDGEKKNAKRFIIPAENFISTEKIPSKKVSEEAKEVIESNEHPEPKKETPVAVELPTSEEKEVITETKPQVDLNKRKKASGLSLKSIQQKKKHEKEIKERLAIPEEELSEDFTEEQVQEAWKDYVKKLTKKGKKILASIVDTDKPTLVGNVIHIELPNDTMRIELQKSQGELLKFIKRKIKNTSIQLEIDVNEQVQKKYAFTTREKFEKLKEKNPLIDKLRTTFDLDIQ